MFPLLKRAVVLCAAAAPILAGTQTANLISGGVYDDHAALAVRTGFTPAAGVAVHVYRDGGDQRPGADDVRVATTRTNAAGVYLVNVESPGWYWVAVDSRTFGPEGTWAEQTFGPAGSLCAQPDGGTRTNYFEGACFGGRTAAGSDDAGALVTSEHLALVTVEPSATAVDFAFSYDAVTSLADGENIQGSFRGFIDNANKGKGPNRMRFVPLVHPTQQRETTFGVPPRWWVITLTSPIPKLIHDDTVIDGTAYNYLAPTSVTDSHPGRIGESPTIKPQDSMVPRLEKPELELVLAGTEGIVCEARCGIRAIALHGVPTPVILRADARIEHVLLGAAPDGEPAPALGSVGLEIERGSAIVRHLLISQESRAGIIVGPEGRIDAERLEISRCGDPQTGAGVVLLSKGSSIRYSTIAANGGAGVIIGSLDGKTPAEQNVVTGCTISSNQGGVILGPGSSRNVIARNDIMWNRLGGVTIAPFDAAPPQENRISGNRFDENGLRPIVLDTTVENPNELMPGGSCERNVTAANRGIPAPRVTRVEMAKQEGMAQVTIRGKACPGEIVELYQSFVTSGVREKEADIPRIRDEDTEETLTHQQREMTLPSIGEFNFLGSTSAAGDGSFEASFPLPIAVRTSAVTRTEEETEVWASQVLTYSAPEDRAFSAIAIDAKGNTSEMGVRRGVDASQSRE